MLLQSSLFCLIVIDFAVLVVVFVVAVVIVVGGGPALDASAQHARVSCGKRIGDEKKMQKQTEIQTGDGINFASEK